MGADVAAPWNILSLCSGIGGLELGVCRALARMGARGRLVGCVERDAYAATCLLARMEEAALDPAPVWVGDIADLDARPLAGHVDLICAGIPCQPWSGAGKKLGAADERHLGRELARVVREVGPRYVFMENVPEFAAWDGLGGLLGELSELGFDAEWGVLPASAVGAPHRRRRLWVLAYARCGGWEQGEPSLQAGQPDIARSDAPHSHSPRRDEDSRPAATGWPLSGPHGPSGDVADPNRAGREEVGGSGQGQQGTMEQGTRQRSGRSPAWAEAGGWNSPTPVVRGVDDGSPAAIRVSDSLRCLGNAVVPDQAAAAFALLMGRIGCQSPPND